MFIFAIVMTISIVLLIVKFGTLWQLFRKSRFVTSWWPLPDITAPGGWEVGRGAFLGALVGSFIFPIAPFVFWLFAWAIRDFGDYSISFSDTILFIKMIFITLIFWTLCAVVWMVFIIMTIPIWDLACRRRVPGPRVAASLGAASAYLTVVIGFLAGKTPVLVIPSQIAAGYVAAAGAISGTIMWWAAYKPDTLKARIRRCPLLRLCSISAEPDDRI